METKIIKVREKNGEMILKEMTLDEVVIQFEGMVYKKAIVIYGKIKRIQQNIDEVEDINIMGMMELIKCYKIYDFRKGAFSTHLTNALELLEARVIRNLFAQKRTTDKGLISLEGDTEELDAFQELMGTEDSYLKNAELKNDITNALKRLNEEERKIIQFLMQQLKTKKEFADELGITRPTLDVRITHAKEKMVKILTLYNIK